MPTPVNNKPTALPALTLTAPLAAPEEVVDALGEAEADEEVPAAMVEAIAPALLLPEDEVVVLVVLGMVAIAAAWYAAKVLVALGLMAKTIPCSQ